MAIKLCWLAAGGSRHTIHLEVGEVDGICVKVMDTSGLFDTKRSNNDVLADLAKVMIQFNIP